MTYLGEFRVNWRALTAACIGMGFGYSLNNYFNNLFIPQLMREFGWSSSSVALLGIASVLSAVGQPLAGRLTDRFGVRRVASCGLALSVTVLILLSQMQGALWQFFALNGLQIAVVAGTTSSVVYSRLVAQSFSRARGLALGLVVCAPSVVATLAVPLLGGFIDSHGWRSGYLVTAGFTALGGLLALSIMPRQQAVAAPSASTLTTRSAWREVVGNPSFALIVAGLCLCSLSMSLQVTQLKVLVESLGISSTAAAWLISAYASGVIAGRLACGAALDRFPTHVVASLTLALPGLGLGILATGTGAMPLVVIAVLLLGLSFGAEGDIAGYLAVKYFPLKVYSTALGAFAGSISLAAAIGAVILGLTLKLDQGFTPFLVISSLAALLTPFLFWRLKRIAPLLSQPEGGPL